MKIRVHHIIAATMFFALIAALYSGLVLFSYRTELNVEDSQVKGILAPWQYDEAAAEQPLKGEELFPAETVRSLQIDVMQAEVSVISWNRPEISAAYSVSAQKEESENDIYIDIAVNEGSLEISTQVRPNSSFTGDVKYQIRIPDRSTQTELSDIRIYGAGGDILLQDMPGNIRILADTVSGSIRMEGGSTAVLKTIQGDVRFTMPAGGDITVRTAGGNVSGILESAEAVSGSLTVQTGTGSIQVDLPETLQANFDIQSKDGSISSQFSDFTLQQGGENRFVGRRGEADYKLYIHTDSGDVSIY